MHMHCSLGQQFKVKDALAISPCQIKNGVGHRDFVELRRSRNNERKRKAK